MWKPSSTGALRCLISSGISQRRRYVEFEVVAAGIIAGRNKTRRKNVRERNTFEPEDHSGKPDNDRRQSKSDSRKPRHDQKQSSVAQCDSQEPGTHSRSPEEVSRGSCRPVATINAAGPTVRNRGGHQRPPRRCQAARLPDWRGRLTPPPAPAPWPPSASCPYADAPPATAAVACRDTGSSPPRGPRKGRASGGD